MKRKITQRTWFKQHQRDGIYHYYEVYGGPGKTKNGYQVVINFLNDAPMIDTLHNYISDPSGLTGTWCRFEVAIPISEAEFRQAYDRALESSDVVIR